MEPKQSKITQPQTIYSKKIQTQPSLTKIKKEKISELKITEINKEMILHLKDKLDSLEQLKNRLENFQIDQKNINQKLERENNQKKKE